MARRKTTKKYYFSVEGETEKWYLEWLQGQINACEEATHKVSIDVKVCKNPVKYAKALVVTSKTQVYHWSDYESDEPVHVKQFMETMDNLKAAKNIGKQIDYQFGYTNLTFDLWIVLHKIECNGSKTHRSHYLAPMNQAYNEKFEDMVEYKQGNNFKRILSSLSLTNVMEAIGRAKKIMEKNRLSEYKLHQYKGYSYYKENPALMVWEAVEKILLDCGVPCPAQKS